MVRRLMLLIVALCFIMTLGAPGTFAKPKCNDDCDDNCKGDNIGSISTTFKGALAYVNPYASVCFLNGTGFFQKAVLKGDGKKSIKPGFVTARIIGNCSLLIKVDCPDKLKGTYLKGDGSYVSTDFYLTPHFYYPGQDPSTAATTLYYRALDCSRKDLKIMFDAYPDKPCIDATHAGNYTGTINVTVTQSDIGQDGHYLPGDPEGEFPIEDP